jgi:tRNA threonylcarbamoyladenosine biosynthesis protein TsaB
MKRLALDTSTDRATLALEVGVEIYTAEQYGVRQHASTLLPMIQQLMQQADLKFNELDEIVFGCGPGSFTGLRVTCSVAKALAYAHDLPLCPINSLHAIAKGTDNIDSEYKLVMLDARMQEVYWGVFAKDLLITPLQVSSISAIHVDLPGKIILTGVGFDEYLAQMPQELQQRIIHTYTVYPDASMMLQCTDGCERINAAQAQPLYIRNNVTQGA